MDLNVIQANINTQADSGLRSSLTDLLVPLAARIQDVPDSTDRSALMILLGQIKDRLFSSLQASNRATETQAFLDNVQTAVAQSAQLRATVATRS